MSRVAACGAMGSMLTFAIPHVILIGFASEEDWFDYRIENDPRFAKRMEAARARLRAGKGLKIKDLKS